MGSATLLLTLALGLAAPGTVVANRQLQEGAAGICIEIHDISGEDFEAGQDAGSLQVSACGLRWCLRM